MKKDLEKVFSLCPLWPEARRILRVLHSKGFKKSYLAGGCVRDALLGRAPKDFDIATEARPKDTLALFPNSQKQGKAFGVTAVMFRKKGLVEVAAFRKDGPYKDGRRPEYVEFLDDKEDALRRDFTVNALFYDVKNKKILDYTGGLKDLKNKILRTVGDPKKRFQEDALRIMRALRFHVQLDFTLNPATKKAVYDDQKLLAKISKERIYEECVKILQTQKFTKAFFIFKSLQLPSSFFKSLKTNSLLSKKDQKFFSKPLVLHPALLKNKAFLWLNVFYPLLVKNKSYFLNAKGIFHSKIFASFKKEKFPVAVIKDINRLFYDSLQLMDFSQKKLYKKTEQFAENLKILNSQLGQGAFYLCEKYLKIHNLKTQNLSQLKKEFSLRANKSGSLPQPLVSGRDLKSLRVKEGPGMARLLKKLYNEQLIDKISSKKKLLQKVK